MEIIRLSIHLAMKLWIDQTLAFHLSHVVNHPKPCYLLSHFECKKGCKVLVHRYALLFKSCISLRQVVTTSGKKVRAEALEVNIEEACD
jgi:hypothetical protein